MKVRLDDVIGVIETGGDEEYFYVIPEETIMSRSELRSTDYEEEDLIRLPDRREVDDYGNMRRFIETVKDDNVREWLGNAIVGRGAFRMFRATLERFHMQELWYDYRDRCHRVTAMDWCEDNGIEYEGPRCVIEERDEDDYDDDFEDDYAEPVKMPAKNAQPVKKEYRFVTIGRKNVQGLIFLASDFTDEMLVSAGENPEKDPDLAAERLEQYLSDGCRITAISDHGRYLGYAVMKEDDSQAVISEIFVRREMRRQGIGTSLIRECEKAAGEDSLALTFRISPADDLMISFLGACGYQTLRTIEIVRNTEESSSEITIGSRRFNV